MIDTFGTIRAFTFTTIHIFDQKLIVIDEFKGGGS